MFKPSFLLIFLLLTGLSATFAQPAAAPLWKNDHYAVYADSVVQGRYTARALSSTRMVSDYQSPANLYVSTKIAFKFSINGKDNEMQPGVDHHYNVRKPVDQTPLIRFGEALADSTGDTGTFLAPDTRLTIRVDMRRVFSDFKTQGYFSTFKGDRIYPEDFKGLFVAGNTLPMIWDFDNLHTKAGLQLQDPDGDGIYETTLVLNAKQDEKQTDAAWTLSQDLSAFPRYQSGQVLADALYNMSLEEMIRAVEPDSTFRTGKEWAGVWTRDISYSIILSMAHLQPEVAKKSLMRKVNRKKRIIQDTGTGGAYPCSTDRMIWATAAWEIYTATGDEAWLREAYEIIRNSVEDDRLNAYDPQTGLVRGESSFLDWREQTYPKWMQPADIYASMNLGTNAVHFQANQVLAAMAAQLGQPADAARYRAQAARIREGMNQYLWMPEKGYYGQYRYGRHYPLLSPGAEALGEALCVLFDIAPAGRSAILVASVPQTAYGITCVYPQIPNIPPYHNLAVWPFVQSYWALAAAKAGNEAAVMASIAAIWRPAALFLTNKENFVATDGDFAGTVINSSNMLWSLSGNIALVHKLLFGIRFHADKLELRPFVPRVLRGTRSLRNIHYRGALIDIELEGYGDIIASCTLDGRPLPEARIPADTRGRHTLRIRLANRFSRSGAYREQPVITAPATPLVRVDNGVLRWQPVKDALHYRVLRNGRLHRITRGLIFRPAGKGCDEYQVVAVGRGGWQSFAAEPVLNPSCTAVYRVEAETAATPSALPYKGYSGKGFVEISTTEHRSLQLEVEVPAAGRYAVSFRYANGHGPVNTENKCAIRTLLAGQRQLGVLVFPQRGREEWSNWGFSNSLILQLPKGKQVFTLRFEEANDNMNEAVNAAMLDYLQLVRLD